jgi:hypothetical protein
MQLFINQHTVIQNNMKKYLVFALFFLIFFKINSQIYITPSSTFSVLTNTPGDELYTAFGHDAFRFKDSIQNIDIVFNYGTFQFSDPKFYQKFVLGKLNYFLSAETYQDFILSRLPMQSVYEQELNLNDKQKQRLLSYLLNNLLPQNRYYLYDFFYDNCATRIRDVLKNVLGDTISFCNYKSIEIKSFRDLIDPNINTRPWLDFGIDLALGLPADKIAKPYEYMFLPEHLMEALSVATIKDNGNIKPLVAKTNTITKKPEFIYSPITFLSPIFIFSFVLIVMLIITIYRYINKKKINYLFDTVFFGLLGLIGFILLFLWFCTDHTTMKNNLNILWAMPFHLLIVFFFKKNKEKKILYWYFLANSILCVLLLICWNFLPQNYNMAVIPLIFISLIRSVRILLSNSYRQVK